MVQIQGKYQYVSSENFEEYMKAIGQLETAGPFMMSTPTIEVKEDGDYWVITVENQGKTATNRFKLGEAYDERLPNYDINLKSLTTRDGDKFTTETQFGPDLKSIRVYEFLDSGMIVHLTENKHGVKASRTYKRI